MPEELKDVHFPRAGVDLSLGYQRQPNRKVAGGVYARTTPVGVNVRGYEPATDRTRGGRRPGLAKYKATRPSGATVWVVQHLGVVANTTGGGAVQASQSGRVVTLVAVSQGNVYWSPAGAAGWFAATNATSPLATPPLNFTGVMQSAVNNQKLYFADGINYVYWEPVNGNVQTWTATAGTLPVDDDSNTPRLICTWRGRTVLSGLLKDAQNWFMSAVSDPHDFDYAPDEPTPTQAVAGNNSALGLIGDVITALIPYTDDVLIFGGDHTLYLMRGDPMAGGSIDLVSATVGVAWGQAWCQDPFGNVYFFANNPAVYRFVPGQQPVRISQAIERLLRDVDTGNSVIRLLWDDKFQGLHVFVTHADAPAAATHFFWESRANAWWTEVFAEDTHNPLCCCTFDGNTPTDRTALVGSWDGYVRHFDPAAADDDGTAIDSEVWLGPLLTSQLDEIILHDVQAVLGEDAGDVEYAIHVGRSAEEALASAAVVTGTWGRGRNLTNLVRRAGHAVFIKLTSSNPWSLEAVRCRLTARGKVRRRGR